ncbi:MAG: hypothetical protein MMC23_002545 [Stictis urceolatum]|nr:hypothetical protein [Stictis urceolata]
MALLIIPDYPPSDLRPELEAIKVLVPYTQRYRNNEVQIHRWAKTTQKEGVVAVKYYINPDKLARQELKISSMLETRKQQSPERLARVVRFEVFLDHLYPPAIGTEFCNAGTIQDILEHAAIEEYRIPSEIIFHLMLQVCEALNWIFRNNVAHGDGHAGNYFLTFEGNNKAPTVKLSDFETAYVLNQSQKDSLNVNTFKRTAWSDIASAANFFNLMFRDRLHADGNKPDERPDIDQTLQRWLDAFFPPLALDPEMLEKKCLSMIPTTFVSHMVDMAVRAKQRFLHMLREPNLPYKLQNHFSKFRKQAYDYLTGAPYTFKPGDEERRSFALGQTLEEGEWVEESVPEDIRAQLQNKNVKGWLVRRRTKPKARVWSSGFELIERHEEPQSASGGAIVTTELGSGRTEDIIIADNWFA